MPHWAVGPGKRLLWPHHLASAKGILIIYTPGTWLKQGQLTAVSHSDPPSGNEYSNLLFLREVLNHMLSSKQAYMIWWIFGLRGKECGRKENKVVQKNRRESKEKTEVK